LKKVNRYSSIRAKELADKGRTASIFDILTYPTAKFLKNFFWQGGYKDKTTGFIYCLLMAFQSFLIRSKLWQISN
jgi:hypothetical protein